jgi:predicted phage tail protein
MKTIILLGELGKRFGRKHRLDVSSAAEAVRALCANFKEFRQFVASSAERNVAYRVVNGKQDIGEDELHHPATHTIVFAPVVMGANFLKKFGMVILGAVLIAASFFLPPLALVGTATLASVTFTIGVSLALGGIAQLLAPSPKAPADEDNTSSYIFSGAVNTSAQGATIPVGYGRLIVGSAVISAGISVEDIDA